MRRQFFSWTSQFTRQSKGLIGGYPPPGARSRRAGQSGWLRSGWFWTIVVLAALLLGASALLSLFSPTPSVAPALSTAVPGDAEVVVPAYDPNSGMAGEIPWGQLVLDMLVKLGIVIALIVGVVAFLRFLRHRIGTFSAAADSPGSFRILDSAELGAGLTVYTVDLGRRVLVLGATSEDVSLLTEVTDPEEIEYLRHRSGVSTEDFGGVLAQAGDAGDSDRFREASERLRDLAAGEGEASTRSGPGASGPSG